MEHETNRPTIGHRVRLKGGEMELVVCRVDHSTQTVDLSPAEKGFSVARNVPFDHIEGIHEKVESELVARMAEWTETDRSVTINGLPRIF